MRTSDKKMKALILENYGEQFMPKQIAIPRPGKGQVLVRIKASGVNPLDLKIKLGNAPHAKTQLPAILGIDMAGIIEAIGNGVDSFKIGDEVYGMTGGIGKNQGSLAEYAAVYADLLALKPKNLTMKEAASLPLAFITAWEGLVDKAKISDEHTVLIHGGAGGVGHIAVQLAKSFGAKVFATGSNKQQELLSNFGAISIDYTKETIPEYVAQYTDNKGFDIIFDTVGGITLDASFHAVKINTGHVVSILGWGNHSLAPLSFRAATYSGVFTLMPLLTGQGRGHHGEILKEATKLIENNQLKPIVDPTYYSLATIESAYNTMENRKSSGKIIIEI